MNAEEVKGSFDIHTPRLILRTTTVKDAGTYHKQRSAPENHPFVAVEGGGSVEKTLATVR